MSSKATSIDIMENKTLVNQPEPKKLLRDIRKELNLTQQQLADILGIARTNLSSLENGKEIPEWFLKAIKLNQLAEQAGYSLKDVYVLPNKDN